MRPLTALRSFVSCRALRPLYTPGVIRNVIFDWSGTLVDDLPAVWRANNSVFRQAGVAELTLEQFRAEFCLSLKNFYRRPVLKVPLPEFEQGSLGNFNKGP